MMRWSYKSMFLVAADVVFLLFSFVLSGYLVSSPIDLFQGKESAIFSFLLFGRILIFLKFGLYHASLRYASVDFLVSIAEGVFLSTLLLAVGFYIAHIHISTRFLFVEWLLTLTFVGGSRFLVRYFWERKNFLQNGKRILIYGSGDMGVIALRQLRLTREVRYLPVAFIDDDAAKTGCVIQGIKVVGTTTRLEEIVEKWEVDELVIAISGLEGEKLRGIVKRCREKNIVCRILPDFTKLLEIEPKMRKVELADLIRRSPRDLNKNEIMRFLKGRRVLITGAAGSIGGELVRQSLLYEPAQVIAFDQSEYGLYALREKFGENCIQYVLGDVTERGALEDLFKKELPEIIFHAAAYKHVPILEENPREAIRNNILGTKIVAQLAVQYGVKSFVLISTDKAVKPSSIMGLTKRVCEIFIQNYNHSGTTEFVAVRFGNVLGSSGSVVPKFLKQINEDKKITITHPEATRYFMLADEAVQLVLQASAIGKGGEIFVLNMGNAIKIIDMAEDLIYLMGQQPHKDVKIEYIGLRPGEKIDEELIDEEVEKKTEFEDITVGKAILFDWTWLNQRIEKAIILSEKGEEKTSLQLLKDLVFGGNVAEMKEQTTTEESYEGRNKSVGILGYS